MAKFLASVILSENQIAMLPPDAARQVLFLDTNLLVLFVTALQSQDLFLTFKRVASNFTSQDGRTLIGIVGHFNSLATNAYVVAETSNLGNSLSGFTRNLWFETLARFAGDTTESHVALRVTAEAPIFRSLGAADAAIGNIPADYVILTTDTDLIAYLHKQRRPVINFNHLRNV